MSAVIVNLPGGPIAANTTPTYTGQFVSDTGVPLPSSNFLSLTLSIVDVLTGSIVNGASQVDILNTGRGTLDAQGNLTVLLEVGDTSMDDVPGSSQVQRALVFDWTTTDNLVGRHQANFNVLSLAGP